jgi:hypothetical protein
MRWMFSMWLAMVAVGLAYMITIGVLQR